MLRDDDDVYIHTHVCRILSSNFRVLIFVFFSSLLIVVEGGVYNDERERARKCVCINEIARRFMFSVIE
jgi:hypothetical protein